MATWRGGSFQGVHCDAEHRQFRLMGDVPGPWIGRLHSRVCRRLQCQEDLDRQPPRVDLSAAAERIKELHMTRRRTIAVRDVKRDCGSNVLECIDRYVHEVDGAANDRERTDPFYGRQVFMDRRNTDTQHRSRRARHYAWRHADHALSEKMKL